MTETSSTSAAETTSTPTDITTVPEVTADPSHIPVMHRMETQSVALFLQSFDSYSSVLNSFNGAIPHDARCPGRSFTVNGGRPLSVFHKVQTSQVHSNGAVFYADGSNKYLKKIAYHSKEKLLELARDSAALRVLSDTGAVPQKIDVDFEYGTSVICRLSTLVMEKVGERSISLKSFRGRNSLRKDLVSIIGIAAINLLETVHARGLVHGDVHEGNFVLDPSHPAQSLRILDFGNARPYIDPITGYHVTQTGATHNKQNPVYKSVFELEGSAVSRRDDLFRLAELVIFLVSGNDYIANAKTTDELVEKKRNRRFDISRVPKGFYGFYKKTMTLGFDQTPNYEEYRTLLRKLELQRPNRSN
jgi:serine/threonine protein kinase